MIDSLNCVDQGYFASIQAIIPSSRAGVFVARAYSINMFIRPAPRIYFT